MKLLFWLIVVLLVIWAWRAKSKRMSHSTGAPEVQSERMIACTHCGVHVPVSQSVKQSNGLFCSVEHGRIHQPR